MRILPTLSLTERKMRTCYLHLGMPKTGSSSIQGAFYRYEDKRLSYAKLSERNHSIPIGAVFSQTPESLREFRWKETGKVEMNKIISRMKGQFQKIFASKKDIIFSGEGIIDHLNSEEIFGLSIELKNHFDKITAISYVRPLASLVSSQFQQRIKMGQKNFILPNPDYRRRFEPILNSFGIDNCLFIRFDRESLIGKDIVKDFSNRIGVERNIEEQLSDNESVTSEALGAIYAFNKYTASLLRLKDRARMRREMVIAMRNVGKNKFGLGPGLIQNHLKKHAEDVSWMEGICRFDVKGKINPVPKPIESEQQLLEMAAKFP